VIVLDASALVELLLDTTAGRRVGMLIGDPALGIHAPHLIDVEAISALRRFARDGLIKNDEAASAIEDLLALDLQRHSHEGLLARCWSLRKNVSVYDAMYVALAEALSATLVTCDGRLGRAPGTKIRVEVVK
jgi:predicted nucleic acid-binding protein